jgi:diphosphomevalonate decarboxylase
MADHAATAEAHPNIAFIKYWGNRDDLLRLPANGSISMNLDGLFTRTTVSFQRSLGYDELIINGHGTTGRALQRVSTFLDLVRDAVEIQTHAEVVSENNFPAGAGIASSASAFAALALAASSAAGVPVDPQHATSQLSRLARRGSGSACRSVPGGFVEWRMGAGDGDSYALSIAAADYWELVDCIAIVTAAHKKVGSTEGHFVAASSALQAARVADTPRRLDLCRAAVLARYFEAFAEVVELDSDMMHAVMMTSKPPLMYWEPGTLEIMRAVREWRDGGLAAAYTVDAGPNVHVLCPAGAAVEVEQRLRALPVVTDVLVAKPGGPARLV